MTGPVVPTDADYPALAEYEEYTVEDIADLVAQRDQARRVAASLEADLARILAASDAHYADVSPTVVTRPWLNNLNAAIAAAREWVGRDTGATP